MAPDKSHGRYIRFLSGIIMLLIIMQPLSYILSADTDRGILLLAEDTESVLYGDNGYMYDTYGKESGLYDYYDMSIENSVKYVLEEENINVKKVSVITDEEKNILRVAIYPVDIRETGHHAEEQDIEKEIKDLISEVYNLDESSIYVIRQVR